MSETSQPGVRIGIPVRLAWDLDGDVSRYWKHIPMEPSVIKFAVTVKHQPK